MFESDGGHDHQDNPWPAFADLLAATTLLFLVFFAAIVIPTILEARGKETRLNQIASSLHLCDVPHDTVGDYLRVTLEGEAVFPFDRSDLLSMRSQGKEALAGIAECIHDATLLGQIDQIQVVGHTSHEGSNERNWRLSSERATTIALYLIESHGVDPCKITALGRSWYYPRDANVPGGSAPDPRDRRVELEIRPIIPADLSQQSRAEACRAGGQRLVHSPREMDGP